MSLRHTKLLLPTLYTCERSLGTSAGREVKSLQNPVLRSAPLISRELILDWGCVFLKPTRIKTSFQLALYK